MRKLLLVCLVMFAAGCATGYQPHSLTGGYSERQLNETTWRVMFAGNADVTHETAQTYWLYRCAELTLAQGYTGFEIISNMKLVSAEGGLVPVYLPMPDKPVVVGTIRMLKGTIAPRPPRVFDAAALKAKLEPYVKGPLCYGNVCPHFHGYLLPDA